MALLVEIARLPREGSRFTLALSGAELLSLWEGKPLPLRSEVHGVEANLLVKPLNQRVVEVQADLTGTYTACCRRCLAPVPGRFQHTLKRQFFPPSLPLTREREEWDKAFLEEWETEEEYDGVALDLELWLAGEVLLLLPENPLCSPDCKGLCPSCGVNRNEMSCACPEGVDTPGSFPFRISRIGTP